MLAFLYRFVFTTILFTLLTQPSLADSVAMQPMHVNPVAAKVVIDTTQCQDAQNIQAVIVLGSGGTGGWQQSGCPAGYLPYSFKSYVGIGFSNGEYDWHFQCCKTKISYT